MKRIIELPYSVGDKDLWAILDKTIVGINIVKIQLEEEYDPISMKIITNVTYMVYADNNASYKRMLSEDEIYPTKSAAILKLTDMENIRHTEELNRINLM